MSSSGVPPDDERPVAPAWRTIEKSFGAVRALRKVSFELRRGEVHAILGENGAGKSTLIKIITGAHAPDAGTFRIDGDPVSHFTPAQAHQRGIACIYQQPALFPDLDVTENIALRLETGSPWRRLRWPERRACAARLLQRLGASIPVEAEVQTLSMPEQQLVEIACALATQARVVIMDEPTASLTRTEQERLFAVIRDLRAAGCGIVYISHRLEEIFALADRVTVLRDGENVGTRFVHAPVPWAGAGAEAAGGGELGGPGLGVASHEAAPIVASSAALTESELIRLMVGRDVCQLYPAARTSPGEILLSLRGLGCRASGVHHVNLELRAGEIVGLAGLMGAGRTELARVLFGLTPADAGEIRLAGEVIHPRTPEEAVALGLAYLPENRRRHGVILPMPISHNISLAVHRRLFPRAWLRLDAERQLASEFVDGLGVKTAGLDAPAASLSGGNQQKVALARWLATRPRVLILDEPTQGVDVGAKAEIHGIVRRLADEGLAVLLISSDLPEVLGLSDRIAVMRGGTITDVVPRRAAAHEVMAAGARAKKGGRCGDEPLSSRTFRHAALASAALPRLRRADFYHRSRFFLLHPRAPTLVVACGMALVIICRQIDISVGSQFAVVQRLCRPACDAGCRFASWLRRLRRCPDGRHQWPARGRAPPAIHRRHPRHHGHLARGFPVGGRGRVRPICARRPMVRAESNCRTNTGHHMIGALVPFSSFSTWDVRNTSRQDVRCLCGRQRMRKPRASRASIRRRVTFARLRAPWGVDWIGRASERPAALRILIQRPGRGFELQAIAAAVVGGGGDLRRTRPALGGILAGVVPSWRCIAPALVFLQWARPQSGEAVQGAHHPPRRHVGHDAWRGRSDPTHLGLSRNESA